MASRGRAADRGPAVRAAHPRASVSRRRLAANDLPAGAPVPLTAPTLPAAGGDPSHDAGLPSATARALLSGPDSPPDDVQSPAHGAGPFAAVLLSVMRGPGTPTAWAVDPATLARVTPVATDAVLSALNTTPDPRRVRRARPKNKRSTP